MLNDFSTPGLAWANVVAKSGQAGITATFYSPSGKWEGTDKLDISTALPTKVTVTDPNGCTSTLAVRKHCQLVATAVFNGRTENVTQFAIWQSSNPVVAKVDVGLVHGGSVGALSTGSTGITASFRGFTSAPIPVTVP